MLGRFQFAGTFLELSGWSPTYLNKSVIHENEDTSRSVRDDCAVRLCCSIATGTIWTGQQRGEQ
jgi:hypothetical protein